MGLRRSGQIVLFRFPQTDLAIGKLRPALLIAPLPSDYDDWLVCMMSSRSRQAIDGIDELISTSDVDFPATGLKSETVVRLTRLAVVADSVFIGSIGELSETRMQTLRSRLADWIVSAD